MSKSLSSGSKPNLASLWARSCTNAGGTWWLWSSMSSASWSCSSSGSGASGTHATGLSKSLRTWKIGRKCFSGGCSVRACKLPVTCCVWPELQNWAPLSHAWAFWSKICTTPGNPVLWLPDLVTCGTWAILVDCGHLGAMPAKKEVPLHLLDGVFVRKYFFPSTKPVTGSVALNWDLPAFALERSETFEGTSSESIMARVQGFMPVTKDSCGIWIWWK